jgi:hypothetical protein
MMTLMYPIALKLLEDAKEKNDIWGMLVAAAVLTNNEMLA